MLQADANAGIGPLGAILRAAFLIWFARCAYAAWFASSSEERDSELLLQRAATLIIVLLLAHSLVDYTLRTTALSAIFCVLLSNARGRGACALI